MRPYKVPKPFHTNQILTANADGICLVLFFDILNN